MSAPRIDFGAAGFIVGLSSESHIARLASRHVLCTAGVPGEAERMARDLVRSGVQALVSFGIAGGLAPDLQPGDLIVADRILLDDTVLSARSDDALRLGARAGPIYGGRSIIADPAGKADLLRRTGALAVDLESGDAARVAEQAGLPFVAIRVVADPASRGLPPAALLPLDATGAPRLASIFRSVARNPGQIPALIATARDTAAALKVLRRVALALPR